MEDIHFNIDDPNFRISSNFSNNQNFPTEHNKKNHFDYIIFKVLDKWFENPKISHILGYDRPLIIEISNGKLEYKPHNESIVTLCSKPAIYFSQNVLEHLKNYRTDDDIPMDEKWKLIEQKTNQILEELKDFIESIENNLVLQIKQELSQSVLVEYTDQDRPEINYYQLNDIIQYIYNEINQNISGGVLHDLMIKKDDSQPDGSIHYQVGTSSRYLYTNKIRTADKFIEIVHAIISDIEYQIALKILKNQQKEINKDISSFKDVINNIKLLYKQTYKLEGSCEICKNL